MMLHPPATVPIIPGKDNQMQMLEDVKELAAYAARLLAELEATTNNSSKRLVTISERADEMNSNTLRPVLKELRSGNGKDHVNRQPDKRFKPSKGTGASVASVFKEDTRPAEIIALRNACRAAPDLSIFEQISPGCSLKFSNPGFFYQEWSRAQQKESDEAERKLNEEKEAKKRLREKKKREVDSSVLSTGSGDTKPTQIPGNGEDGMGPRRSRRPPSSGQEQSSAPQEPAKRPPRPPSSASLSVPADSTDTVAVSARRVPRPASMQPAGPPVRPTRSDVPPDRPARSQSMSSVSPPLAVPTPPPPPPRASESDASRSDQPPAPLPRAARPRTSIVEAPVPVPIAPTPVAVRPAPPPPTPAPLVQVQSQRVNVAPPSPPQTEPTPPPLDQSQTRQRARPPAPPPPTSVASATLVPQSAPVQEAKTLGEQPRPKRALAPSPAAPQQQAAPTTAMTEEPSPPLKKPPPPPEAVQMSYDAEEDDEEPPKEPQNTLLDDPVLKKFALMQKMNMPQGAIEQAMIRANLEPSLLFGTSAMSSLSGSAVKIVIPAKSPTESASQRPKSSSAAGSVMEELLQGRTLRKVEVSEKSPPKVDASAELMQGIVDGRNKLKKVETPVEAKKAAPTPSNLDGGGVASILARRIAIIGDQGSDDESVGSEWDEDDDD